MVSLHPAESGKLSLKYGFTTIDFFKSPRVLQMFARSSESGTIEVLVAEVLDDFLFAGDPQHIQELYDPIVVE